MILWSYNSEHPHHIVWFTHTQPYVRFQEYTDSSALDIAKCPDYVTDFDSTRPVIVH